MTGTDPGRTCPTAARYVEDQSELADLVEEIAAAPVYGFDTEFHRERTYYARLALLQIAWPGGIALIDPLATDVAVCAKIFSGPGVAIVHACSQDLEILDRVCGVVPTEIFDTQVAAGFCGMSSPSLGSLVERFLSVRMEKGDQLTDWTRRPLTPTQLQYAAGDVAYLLELAEALRARLRASGRLGWAEAECALVRDSSIRQSDPETAWWGMRQARQLRGAQRGIAQAVAAWRERRAQSLDVPVRSALSDLALASMVQRAPRTRAELEAVRGIDGRSLSGGGAAELLAAIERGRALPASALRLPPSAPDATAPRPAVALAAAFAQERARELGFDPAVLATRADIAAFLNDPPAGRLVTSWRSEILGEPLRRVAEGTAALAFDRGVLVLEERSGIPILAPPPSVERSDPGVVGDLPAH